MALLSTSPRDEASLAEAFRAQLAGLSSRDLLRDGTALTLADRGRFTRVELLEEAPAPAEATRYDTVLKLEPTAWGLRQVDSGDPGRFASFIDIKATMTRSGDPKAIWEESMTVLGRVTRPLSEFREEPRLTQEGMRAVVRAAAVRIADEIGGPRRGGLDSATGVRVSVTELADRRPETDKIGHRRGSGGGIIGTFQAPKPIPALQEAISGELVKNGMLVDGAQPDRVLAGTITAFWIDDLAGVGEVAVEIEVRDASTGEVRHTGQYVGRDTMHGYGSDEDWGEVMNGAVEDMVRALGADSKLVEALKARPRVSPQ